MSYACRRAGADADGAPSGRPRRPCSRRSCNPFQLLFAGDLGRRGHQVAHQRSIFGQRLRRGADVLFGNDKQMGGSLRIDVGKADAKFVFVDPVGGNGAVNDLAKQAVGRRRVCSALSSWSKVFRMLPGRPGVVSRGKGCTARRSRDGRTSRTPRTDAASDRPARSRPAAETPAASSSADRRRCHGSPPARRHPPHARCDRLNAIIDRLREKVQTHSAPAPAPPGRPSRSASGSATRSIPRQAATASPAGPQKSQSAADTAVNSRPSTM